MSNRSVSISTDTIFRVILILLLVVFLYVVKDILALLFIAIVLSAAFDPLVDNLQKIKFPRALSIILVYIVLFTVVGGAIFLLTGPIIEQITDMSKAFPEFYVRINESLQNWGGLNSFNAGEALSGSISDITTGLSRVSSSIFGALSSIFGGIIGFFTVLLVAFYLTVQEDGMKRFISNLSPARHRPYITKLTTEMQHRMGYWLRGQLLLSLIVFVLVYTGLSILGVKYALLLALLAGIFEIVPFLGPWISAIPGVFFAFSQGLGTAIGVAIMYFVVQQIENNFIVPKVMGKSTGLNPIVVILSILVGARLGGVIGALLAVPIATAIAVYVESLMGIKSRRESRLEK